MQRSGRGGWIGRSTGAAVLEKFWRDAILERLDVVIGETASFE